MSLKKDWNYVKNAMRTPCNNGGIDLYIETGLQAAGIAALDIVSFGCREPIKFALGRGQVADWFGRGNTRGIQPMPHRKPRTSGGLKPPTVSAGPSFFWHFAGLLERTLFMVMLVNVGKQFVLDWHSLLMAANGCDGPYQGYCEFNIQPQIVGPNPTEMLIGALPDCHGVLSDIRRVYIPLGITPNVSYHVEAVPWVPAQQPDASLSTYLADVETGEAWAASTQGAPGTGSNGTLGFQKNLPARPVGFRRISVVGTSTGYSYIKGGKLQVTLRGNNVKFFAPPDCFKEKVDGAFDKWLQKQVS